MNVWLNLHLVNDYVFIGSLMKHAFIIQAAMVHKMRDKAEKHREHSA